MPASKLLTATPDALIRLAAVIWFTGVIVLLFKSTGMFIEAAGKGASVFLTSLAVLSGLSLGVVKSKYLFVRVCVKNINRIRALASPKIWQCYRGRFFFFLACMIISGDYAYSLARDNIDSLLCLAVLELSVGTALFISARCFFNRSRFQR